eukprot:369023_1
MVIIHLKIIEIPPHHIANNNPMNDYTIPIRGNTINTEDLNEFTCNRTQIKPYYESYNEQYDGIKSPAVVAIKALQIAKSLVTNIDHADHARKLLIMVDKYNVRSLQCCHCVHAFECQQACFSSLKISRISINILNTLHHLIL